MGAKISNMKKNKSKLPNLGYELLRLIGHGIDDKVFECIDTKSKKKYALKLMEIKTTEEYQKTSAFRNILLKLKALNHPNIMPIISAEFQENKDYYGHTEQFLVLIMELSITSLENLINQRAKGLTYWSEKELARIVYNLADGFENAQRLGIPHRDVKDRNILVVGNNYVIADFGDSKLSSLGNFKGLDSLSASVSFMAPEVFQAFENARSTPDYDLHKADVYSLGLVMLKMAKLNLNSHREQRDISKEIEAIYHYPNMSYVIKKMLETKPEKRISFSAIKTLVEDRFPGIKNYNIDDDMTNNRQIIANTFKASIESEEHKGFEHMAKGYYDLGIYSEALRYYNMAMDSFILARNSDEGLLRYRSQIAACYRQLGLPKKAFENDFKALELLKKLRQTETTKAAIVYSSLATDHSMLEDYLTAIEYHKLSLEIKRKSAGDDSFIVAETYINMAFEYDQLEDNKETFQYTKEALTYNTKALEIFKKIFGKHIKHRSLAMVYEKIGENNSKMGILKKSIKYKQKALSIRRKIFGDEHPLIIETEHSIGKDYSAMGQHRQALESFNKAKGIACNHYGETNLYYAQILEDLSFELYQMQNYNQALEHAKQCLKIRENSPIKDQETIGKILNHIGSIYFAMGIHQSAISFKKKALDYIQKFLNPEHPDLAKYYKEIGDSYTMLGDKKSALQQKTKSLDILEGVFEDRSLLTAEAMWSLASTYLQFMSFDDALDYQNRSLGITERLCGKESSDAAIAHHRLGTIYQKKNNLEIALTHYKKAYGIMDKDPGVISLALADLALDYGEALMLLGKHDEGFEKKHKSLDIKKEILGDQTIEVAKCLESIATSYMKYDDFISAVDYMEKAKSIYAKCFETEDNTHAKRLDTMLTQAHAKMPSKEFKSYASVSKLH